MSHFSPKARAFLRSLSDLPWATTESGAIRVLNPDGERVCPVSMGANRRLGAWKYRCHWGGLGAQTGLNDNERSDIAWTADCPSALRRDEMVALLGGLRVKGPNGEPVVAT